MTILENISKALIGNALHSAASNHVVAVASDIYDENKKGYQSEINADIYNKLSELETNGGGNSAPVISGVTSFNGLTGDIVFTAESLGVYTTENSYSKNEINGLLAKKADVSAIPNITGKADKATTLAGYNITDAYTKNETDAKISEATVSITYAVNASAASASAARLSAETSASEANLAAISAEVCNNAAQSMRLDIAELKTLIYSLDPSLNSDQAIQTLNAKLADSVVNVTNIQKTIGDYYEQVTEFQNIGYIFESGWTKGYGDASNPEHSAYTNPIKVSKGDIVYVKGVGSGCSAITFTQKQLLSEEQELLEGPTTPTQGLDLEKQYSAVAPYDGYVVICARVAHVKSSIYRQSKFNSMKSLVDEHDSTIEKIIGSTITSSISSPSGGTSIKMSIKKGEAVTLKINSMEPSGLVWIHDALSINGSTIQQIRKTVSNGGTINLIAEDDIDKIMISTKNIDYVDISADVSISLVRSGRLDALEAGSLAIKKSDQSIHIPSRPSLPNDEEGTYTIVSTESQLRSAINAGGFIRLANDITVSSKLTISKPVVINGVGHSLHLEGSKFTPSAIGRFASANYSNPVSGTEVFVANGKVLQLSRSLPFDLIEGVETADGTAITIDNYTIGQQAGEFRFKLPSDLTITDTDNVYINITAMYDSYICKVTRQSNGYVYFQKDVTRCTINGDVTNYNRQPNVYFINYKPSVDSVTIKGGKIYFDPKFENVSIVDDSLFEVEADLTVYNTVLFGSPSEQGKAIINATDANVVLRDVKMYGAYHSAVRISNSNTTTKDDNPPSLYVDNCEIYDCQRFAINSNRNTFAYVTNCNVHDTCQSRMYDAAISAVGSFYIAYNKITDYGISALNLGTNAEYIGNHKGIAEHNIIRFSPDYMNNASIHVNADSGAIYIGTNSDGIYIIDNVIDSYTGRGHNQGIYCDDGCCNIYMLRNIIGNIPNSFAIDARQASRSTSTSAVNTNKVAIYNVVDAAIRIIGKEGINGCIVGYNLQGSGASNSDNQITNVDINEGIITTPNLRITNGVPVTSANLRLWGFR